MRGRETWKTCDTSMTTCPSASSGAQNPRCFMLGADNLDVWKSIELLHGKNYNFHLPHRTMSALRQEDGTSDCVSSCTISSSRPQQRDCSSDQDPTKYRRTAKLGTFRVLRLKVELFSLRCPPAHRDLQMHCPTDNLQRNSFREGVAI